MKIKLVANHRIEVTDRINSFHVLMFHGISRRQDPDWKACDHKLTDYFSNPVLYTCNAYQITNIATPSLNYVVSKDVEQSLRDFSGIYLIPVKLEKVINLPYSVGDFSYFDKPEFWRNPRSWGPEKVFHRWPDCPELHASIGSRYEVAIAFAENIAPSYPDVKEINLPDPTGNYRDPEPTPLSRRMMVENSIVHTIRGKAMTLEVFNILEKYLDKEYYAISDLEI